jgi:hypothetical protein
VYQETFKEIIVKKEEAIAEREEHGSRDKEATTKSFVDLQERSVAANEAIAKARLLEAEVKTNNMEAEAKARFLEARTKLLEAEAKTKLLEAEALLVAEENKIMLTDLDTNSYPIRREWFENRQKMLREHLA